MKALRLREFCLSLVALQYRTVSFYSWTACAANLVSKVEPSAKYDLIAKLSFGPIIESHFACKSLFWLHIGIFSGPKWYGHCRFPYRTFLAKP